jgi:hypothetical protein
MKTKKIETITFFPIFAPVIVQKIESLKKQFVKPGEMPLFLQNPPTNQWRFQMNFMKENIGLEGPHFGFLVGDVLNEVYCSRLSHLVEIWSELQAYATDHALEKDSTPSYFAEDFQIMLMLYAREEKELKAVVKLIWQEINAYIKMLNELAPYEKIIVQRLISAPFDSPSTSPVREVSEKCGGELGSPSPI